jgi:pimeloyl-ACP methyl ester carboxylesterase
MPDPIEPFLTASADSTPLSPSRLQLVGGGSNLIVVPSSLDETSGWLPVAEALTEHRVWLLDRSEPLEQEDRAIDALADTIIRAILSLGGIPAVFAHGSGAIALLQALITEPDLPVSRVVLYEPPLPVGGPVVGRLLPELVAAVERRDLEYALHLYMDRVAHFPAQLAEQMAVQPHLQAMMPALLPELRQIDQLLWTVADAERVSTPILLLLGELSADHPNRRATLALADVLPEVELQQIDGHGHFAHRSAPHDVAARTHRFLTTSPTTDVAAA